MTHSTGSKRFAKRVAIKKRVASPHGAFSSLRAFYQRIARVAHRALRAKRATCLCLPRLLLAHSSILRHTRLSRCLTPHAGALLHATSAGIRQHGTPYLTRGASSTKRGMQPRRARQRCSGGTATTHIGCAAARLRINWRRASAKGFKHRINIMNISGMAHGWL